MNTMRNIIALAAILIPIACTVPASAAVSKDDKAGYTIQYDEAKWVPEDITNMFGDLTKFDDKLVSTPFVVVNHGESEAAIIVVVSKRDDYDNDVLAFIKKSMGKVTTNSVYEEEDTFTDSTGDEYGSKVRVWGVTPEYEDEGILLSQIFFTNGKRYEICFLALPDNFTNAWETAKAIMDSIDVK